MPPAVPPVYEPYGHSQSGKQGGVCHQLVVGGDSYEEHHAQLERGLDDAHVGKCLHPLVGYQRGVVRHAHHVDGKGAQRELVDPVGGGVASGREVHAAVEEPKAHGFAGHHYDARERHVDHHRRGEHTPHVAALAPAYLHGEKPLRGRGQRAAEEGEHRHQPAHHVVYAEVGLAEHIEHHARCVEAHRHGEQHPRIQGQCVLGYALVVLHFCRHTLQM